MFGFHIMPSNFYRRFAIIDQMLTDSISTSKIFLYFFYNSGIHFCIFAPNFPIINWCFISSTHSGNSASHSHSLNGLHLFTEVVS